MEKSTQPMVSLNVAKEFSSMFIAWTFAPWLRLRAGFNWWKAWGPVYLGGTERLQQLYD